MDTRLNNETPNNGNVQSIINGKPSIQQIENPIILQEIKSINDTQRTRSNVIEKQDSIGQSVKSQRSVVHMTQDSIVNASPHFDVEADIEKGGEEIYQHMESRLPSPNS